MVCRGSLAKQFLAGAFLVVAAFPAFAQVQGVVPEDKVWLLPPFCQDRLNYGETGEKVQKWVDMIGAAPYTHIHHYCWAIYKINYQAVERGISAGDRVTILNSGVGDIEYVLKRTSADFPLRYTMLVLQAQALTSLKRQAEAAKKLQEAVSLRPTEEIAYFRLAQVQISTGATAQARETILTGLKQKPDSKGLQRLLKSVSSKGASADAGAKPTE